MIVRIYGLPHRHRQRLPAVQVLDHGSLNAPAALGESRSVRCNTL